MVQSLPRIGPRVAVRAVVFVILSLGATVGLYAQEQAVASAASSPPAWLLLEQGKQAFRDRNFGTALALFRESIATGGETPEADAWIGRVFEEEGELKLAVDQYNRALALKQQFVVREDALTVRYALVNIYYETNEYGKYEVALRKIVAEDKYFINPDLSGMRDAMLRILHSGGFDRLMLLYRLTDLRTLAAHSELGAFMYRTGRYRDATLNLAFSTITDFTTAIEELRRINPDFEFTSIQDLLARSLKDPRLAAYFVSVHLYRDLYYLAASLYANGIAGRAREIWSLDIDYAPKESPWRQRSIVQSRSPFIEPLLDIGQ